MILSRSVHDTGDSDDFATTRSHYFYHLHEGRSFGDDIFREYYLLPYKSSLSEIMPCKFHIIAIFLGIDTDWGREGSSESLR
jgi:hypothetical protein